MLGAGFLLDDDEENPDATNGLGRKHSAEEKVAMLGRPKLGETTRCQIRIKESKEFKVGPTSPTYITDYQPSISPHRK